MRRERALRDKRSIAGGLGTPITRALMMLAAHSARGPRARQLQQGAVVEAGALRW